MELGLNMKRGAGYFILALFFLLSLYIVVAAFSTTYGESDDVIIVGPENYSNVSGNVVIQLNVSGRDTDDGDDGTEFNVTNVTFFITNNYGGVTVLGTNTTANLSIYTFHWNTADGNYPDNTTYHINVSVQAANATDGSELVFNDLINISHLDNTAPTIVFVNDTPTSNPDQTDYINSTAVNITINYTVHDLTFGRMYAPCNVTVDYDNATGGGDINGTGGLGNYTNGTLGSLFFTLGTSMEGVKKYRVQCIEEPDYNLTGNSTGKTFTLDLSKPMINLSFLDVKATL